jgi:hypothetical protein
MEDIRPDGHLSIVEYAHVCNIRESHVRTQLSAGKIPSVKLGQRRWIPESAVIAKFADLLVSVWTQEATLQRLRVSAADAGVELPSDDELIHNARLYINAADAEPSDASIAGRELVALGD